MCSSLSRELAIRLWDWRALIDSHVLRSAAASVHFISLCILPSTRLYKGWLPTYLYFHFFTTAWSFSLSQKKNIDRDCRSTSIFIFMFVFQHFLPFLFCVSLYYKYINWHGMYEQFCHLFKSLKCFMQFAF